MTTDTALQLETLCDLAEQHEAADILLHENHPARFRIAGRIETLEMEPLKPEFFDRLWDVCNAPRSALDHDTSFVSGNGVRFRVNLLRFLGSRASVLRRISTEIPSMAELGLPDEVLQGWALRRSGIILISGPTGSGKSTTLAAILGWLNNQVSRHVVTIEDPVEYVFKDNLSVFTQREVGIDTPTFAEGLRRSLRQNPDVIMLGEVRDAVSANTAFQAAETGHLVLTTVHSANAVDSIERLNLIFPPNERDAARSILSEQLIGVLAQKLLPKPDVGVALACEYMTNEGAVARMIEENRLADLTENMLRADPLRTRTFLYSLAELVRGGQITESLAQSVANSPQELSRALRGISSNTSGRR
jgi:twitching motility protein PilT